MWQIGLLWYIMGAGVDYSGRELGCILPQTHKLLGRMWQIGLLWYIIGAENGPLAVDIIHTCSQGGELGRHTDTMQCMGM